MHRAVASRGGRIAEARGLGPRSTTVGEAVLPPRRGPDPPAYHSPAVLGQLAKPLTALRGLPVHSYSSAVGSTTNALYPEGTHRAENHTADDQGSLAHPKSALYSELAAFLMDTRAEWASRSSRCTWSICALDQANT